MIRRRAKSLNDTVYTQQFIALFVWFCLHRVVGVDAVKMEAIVECQAGAGG